MSVIQNLEKYELPGPIHNQQLQKEIEQFISNYLALREVEKKALKESGMPYSGHQLKQTSVGLLVLATSAAQTNNDGSNTERYCGGAKEQAQENMEGDIATSTDLAILVGLLCASCGGDRSASSEQAGVASTYCSRECAEQHGLKRAGYNQIRAQVFALEGGVCRLCGIDAHALYTRIRALQPAERLNALCNTNWKLPKTSKALDNLLQKPNEGNFWQADHIVAVAEGGGGCELENLRTLCVPCHAGETEKLLHRLRLNGGPKREEEDTSEADDGGKRQRDIRSMFQPAELSQKLKLKKDTKKRRLER
jgi:5-methylcytosine-specific restriction endonuclease McrA